MGKVSGYTCDACTAFEVAEGSTTPKGWILLPLKTEHDLKESGFIVCSNLCAAKLFVLRANDVDGAHVKLTGESPGRSVAARKGAHARHHVGQGVVNEACEFCQEETAP